MYDRWMRIRTTSLAIALLSGAAANAADARAQAFGWDKARDPNARYREVLDLGGLAEIGFQIPASLDPEDLAAVCQARKQGMASAGERAQSSLNRLGDWSDPVTDAERARLHRALASVAAFSGDIDAAVRNLEGARQALAPHVPSYPDLLPSFTGLQQALGVAYMRQAEVQNCLVNPGADRCLFPLRPGGIHHRTAGAEAARGLFEAVLAKAPSDLEVRWLLNLASMVLGRYPGDVPKAHLLPPSVFRSETRLPRFVDVAPRAGLGRRDAAGGTVADDLDGDGLVDIVLSSVDPCSPLRFYRNRGEGTFEDRSEGAQVQDQLGGINLVQADYDNDGRLDLFVMRGGWESAIRNSLLRNEGEGRFRDVTRAAGLSSGGHATHSAAWADYDNDGWLDVFVGHEQTPSQLFRNRGDGTFEDVSARARVDATAFTKGVAWGDYDKDGDPDLYVSNFGGPNFLYRNNGDGTFADVAAALGVQGPSMTFPTWFFDYDNDGWLDIFVGSFVFSIEPFVGHYLGQPPPANTLTLYRNRGDGTFIDVTKAAGLDRVIPAMGANFGDLDNDGFLDVYLGTGTPSLAALVPNIMLKNDAGKRFLDVTEVTGTGHLQKGHGVAFADVDDDGDEDVVLNVGGSFPGDSYDEALFQNPGGSGNRWLKVRLVGVKTNRSAIGAQITIRSKGDGSKLRYREVSSGGSFGAQGLTQHVGLGRATSIESLEIFWPASRTRQVLRDVPVDTFIEVREQVEGFTTRHPRKTLPQPE
jgi:FG-GAP-like repeat/ASPIC and UnbV